jgi:hypothetical protein
LRARPGDSCQASGRSPVERISYILKEVDDMQTYAIDTLDQLPDESLLDLGIEELDEVVAPGFWDWAAGIGVGTIVGGGALYLGIAAAT